jgi:hypothetical protein
MCRPHASGHISASSLAVSLYPDFHRNLTPDLGTGFKENPVMDPRPPCGTLLHPSIPVSTAFLLQDIPRSRTLVHARNMDTPFLFGRLGPETRVPRPRVVRKHARIAKIVCRRSDPIRLSPILKNSLSPVSRSIAQKHLKCWRSSRTSSPASRPVSQKQQSSPAVAADISTTT